MKWLTSFVFPNSADATRRRDLKFLLLAILLSLLITAVIVICALIFFVKLK